MNRMPDGSFEVDSSVLKLTRNKKTPYAPIITMRNGSRYLGINKIKDYLYEIWYDKLNYDYAFGYFEKNNDDVNIGGCSSVRNGNWYGRNLDWIYDDRAEFIVHVPAVANRYASIGVAGGVAGLTNLFVESGADSSLYEIVPFKLYDGINENGVVANINVVPLDKGKNIGLPAEVSEVDISSTMLVRYILDNFGSATEAVEYIRDHVTVHFSKELHAMGYEVHYMVADKDKTYLLEFIDNSTVVSEMEKPYMTNFYLEGVAFNEDGTVYTPETMTEELNAIDTNGITPFGSGLERYNLIAEGYSSTGTKDGMRALMDKLKYTKTYSTSDSPADPFWYTEFVGQLTVADPASEFADVVSRYGEVFAKRSRNSDVTTWQTVHSVVYDIESRKMFLVVQEDGQEIERSLFSKIASNVSEETGNMVSVEKFNELINALVNAGLMKGE